MQKLLEFLVDGVMFIVDYVVTFVQDIVYVIGTLGGAVAIITGGAFNWLPQAFVTAMVSCVAIVVIYKIIGREG